MRPMTVGATGGTGSPQGVAGSVDAAGVSFGRLLVAGAAIDRPGHDIVVRVLVGHRVATDARIGAVDRPAQPGFVNEQGNTDARRVGLVKRLVGMAVQAGGVWVLFRAEQRQRADKEQNQQPYRGRRFYRLQPRCPALARGTAGKPTRVFGLTILRYGN